jgi:hypothetical protein
MMRATAIVLLVFFPVLLQADAKEIVSITGAGPSIDITEKFISVLRENPWIENRYRFRLDPDSTKHAGGIKNTDQHLFGRTGRPLSLEEKALGKKEIFLAKIPTVFATSRTVGIEEITIDQLRSVYLRKVSSWAQLNGDDVPIFLVGRENAESIFMQLKQAYPFFSAARFDIILYNDTAVINYLKHSRRTGLAFGSAPNLTPYYQIRVKGMDLARKVGLVFDAQKSDHPLVKLVINTAVSKQWKNRLTPWGYQPVNH